jgi:alanyl-tRNA synthetase
VALAKAEALVGQAVRLPSGITILVQQLQDVDAASLGVAAQRLQERLGDAAAVVLGSAADDKVSIVAAFSPVVVKAGASAGSLVGPLAKLCGGGGGGKPAFAQAGGRDATKLADAIKLAREQLEALLNK